ncbi:sugar transferase [Raineya orbicola]|uniref:Sugar transferases involved in lipopolysaccharide synthesis n=1 Tax=Raineya orbicola TaxID=2016530 RepID=A0A2N3IHT5_9BACT|nr:sugar transferase [Raineya orbicola]PKQ69889.1 Sugar transferases involved in lipopolysaccharide synthesis [Raineya orbicola]
MFYKKFGKPLLDKILTLLFVPVLLPLFVAVFFLLLLTQRGKVFFVQVRPGYQCKPFKIYKFRTLKDTEGTDEERATSLGRFLRKTNLDELPQMLNILKGEMSWVGPRPLLMEYVPHYNTYQQKRHNVLPGITGIAQLQLPKDAPFTEKANLDAYYAENVSFILDLKIILQTFRYFLGKRNFAKI